MRKLIMWQMVTVDGLFEGPGGDIGWFAFDEDLGKYIDEVHHEVGTYIYGRETYRMMATTGPPPKAHLPGHEQCREIRVFRDARSRRLEQYDAAQR